MTQPLLPYYGDSFSEFPRDHFFGVFGGTLHIPTYVRRRGAIALKLGCRKIKTKKKNSRWEKFDSYENDSYENHTYHLRGALLIGPFFLSFPPCHLVMVHGSWFMEGVDLNI